MGVNVQQKKTTTRIKIFRDCSLAKIIFATQFVFVNDMKEYKIAFVNLFGVPKKSW